MTTASPSADPLAAFTRFSACVRFYDPPSSTPTIPEHPRLILLCTWLEASPRHISKYTAHYLSAYPSSRVLLLTCSNGDFGPTRISSPLAPALAAVSALPPGEPILAHVFSNGGGHQLRQLSALHHVPLAIRALVLDSCPGSSQLLTAARGLAATVRGLPWHARIPALASIYFLFVVVAGVAQYILRLQHPVELLRRALLDGTILPADARVTYLCGEDDEVVLKKDVMMHADAAEAAGAKVKRVVFEGTKHVGHVRGGEKRYWEAVGNTWTGEGWE